LALLSSMNRVLCLSLELARITHLA
jgi:hypothetical protein